MYTQGINTKTKKELKEIVASGRKVSVYQPGPFAGSARTCNAKVCLEGPKYPQPHKWYATAQTDANGYIIPGTVK